MKRQVTKIHLHFIKPNENQIRKNKKSQHRCYQLQNCTKKFENMRIAISLTKILSIRVTIFQIFIGITIFGEVYNIISS